MWFSGNINIHKHNDNEAMKHVIINLGELLFADLTQKLGTNKSSKGSVTGKVTSQILSILEAKDRNHRSTYQDINYSITSIFRILLHCFE